MDPLSPGQRSKHDRAARAINHPIRKRMLEVILDKPVDKESLITQLINEGVLPDASHFKYHASMLLNAECIELQDGNYHVTKAGEAVRFT